MLELALSSTVRPLRAIFGWLATSVLKLSRAARTAVSTSRTPAVRDDKRISLRSWSCRVPTSKVRKPQLLHAAQQ